jgi:hypothetical protein
LKRLIEQQFSTRVAIKNCNRKPSRIGAIISASFSGKRRILLTLPPLTC